MSIQYEEVCSLNINETSILVGTKLHCLCEYEVIKLHPVWHIDGRHFPNHFNNTFSCRRINNPKCIIHYVQE